MPGNWDPVQHLQDGRVEWPKGPTDRGPVDEGFHPWRVEAWVVQGGGMGKGTSYEGPSQSTSHSSSWSGWGPSNYRWIADTPGGRQGSFQPGHNAAVGIAFVTSRNTAGTYKYNWWSEVISLQYEINEDAIIDGAFKTRFEEQTEFLRHLEKQFHDAVERAEGRIRKMEPGKSTMKEVFDL